MMTNILKYRPVSILLVILLGVSALSSASSAAPPRPNPFGPMGFGGFPEPWQKPVEVKVAEIHEGSPAHGQLNVGDVIVGIGDKAFTEDPRPALAKAVDAAESAAAGGKLTLLLKSGKQVTLKLPVLGGYSPTAPYNCPKTDKIINQTAERLLNDIKNPKYGLLPTKTVVLGLMATGEKKYIDAAAKLIKASEMLDIDPKQVDAYLEGQNVNSGIGLQSGVTSGWGWGYSLITLGEYYLLTKDESVLPAIRTYALALARGQDGVGFWGHRMARKNGRSPGYGTMSQSSVSNFMGMLIAQKCGIKDPVLDQAVDKTYATVENIAGKGGFAYGSGGISPDTYNNNGTSGAAAICMSLRGDQKGAAYFSRSAATTYDSLTSGHASAFFNPLWTPLGASLSGPEVTQQFFKNALWYFDMKRDWRGGFTGQERAGSHIGQGLLTYCLPRKALLITGREADESIFVKGAEATKVIMRSKIDYKSKSHDELCKLFSDPFIQVRSRAVSELSGRLSKAYQFNSKGKNEIVTPKLLAIIESGNEQERITAIHCLGANPTQAKLLVDIINDKEEAFAVRVAAVSAIGYGNFREAALPYYNDILRFTLEKRPVADPFGEADEKIATALIGMLKQIKNPESHEDFAPEQELVYKVANQLLENKRQNVRNDGMKMLKGIPLKDFHLVAENLIYVLDDKDPDYSTYSGTVNSDGISILAELNIKEGLDYLVDGIFHRGGKWGFKYRALIGTLPLYGANAKPYIEKFEAHRNINKKGDRFTPAWQKAVKQINEDKSPKKLMTIEEVLQATKAK